MGGSPLVFYRVVLKMVPCGSWLTEKLPSRSRSWDCDLMKFLNMILQSALVTYVGDVGSDLYKLGAGDNRTSQGTALALCWQVYEIWRCRP